MKISALAVLGGLLAESALGAVVSRGVTAESNDNKKCTSACDFLGVLLYGKVSLPGSTEYDKLHTTIWSQQAAGSSPTCRVTPTNAVDVSIALLMLRAVGCQYAVKGGGHTPFAGANNIDNGVTIDLSGLVSVTLKKDDTEVQIGGGARWGAVYPVLEPKNLTVIGGRISSVGVGGLTTGGGISHFSGRHGWACDNVNNYQVVFADGIIRDVNQKSYPAVFKALKGGGSNFGIVTRFDLATIPQGQMWGGMARYKADGVEEPIINALESYNIHHPEDPDCAVIVSYIYRQIWMMIVILDHAKPVANPALLKNFTDIPATLGNTQRITTLSVLADELGESQPAGDRQSFWTFTIHNSAELMLELNALFKEEIEKLAAVADLLAALNYQVISKATTSNFAKNGGNSLGLTADDVPLILVNVATTWTGAGDDALLYATIDSYMTRAKAAAQAKGMLHPYVYLNYADASANVFDSYGAASKAELLATHKKWDPLNVFTQLQPGGHKLK